MSLLGVATAAATVMLTAAITLAAPASASPDSPCGATLIPICAFVPVLPGLDHDVDLTTDPDPGTHTPDDAQSPGAPIDGR
ncbi:MAG TPA: fibronectin-binding protein [Mycobacterium sp.]|nr:fibronectin-binding protein [Mycobacterium sp.]